MPNFPERLVEIQIEHSVQVEILGKKGLINRWNYKDIFWPVKPKSNIRVYCEARFTGGK